jgi:CRISPR-associated protein Cas1
VASAIKTVGLDPFIGYLHSSQYGKPALALDLVEEFRPIIADSVVLTVANNRMLELSDFEEDLGSWRLNDRGRREFLRRFEERLDTAVEHPVFGYQATYRRCLELQVRLLGKYLTEEITTYPPFLVR